MNYLFSVILLVILSCNTMQNENYYVLPTILIDKDGKIINLSKSEVILDYSPYPNIAIGSPYIFNSKKVFALDFYNLKVVRTYKNKNTYGFFNSQLLLFDFKGQFIDTIVKTKKDEKILNVSTSKEDKYLCYALVDKDIENNYFDLKPISLIITDMISKEQIYTINDLCYSIRCITSDRAWSSIGNKFTFSILEQPNIVVKTSAETSKAPYKGVEIKEKGIYLIDIDSIDKGYTKIRDDGFCPAWHPSEDKFIYIKDQSIWLYDYNTKKDNILYKANNNEDLLNVNWSPDGNYFLINGRDASGVKNIPLEKLINYRDGFEVKHVKIGLGYSPFSWR